MDRQSSLRQERTRADGSLPSALHFPTSPRDAQEEARSARVRRVISILPSLPYRTPDVVSVLYHENNNANHDIICRFMADKIMPLSEAVEGYEIFDAMKVQKVIFEVD